MTDREKFEDWLVSDATYMSPARGPSGLYAVPSVEVAWWAWQASRKQMAEEAAAAIDSEARSGRKKQEVRGTYFLCADLIRSLATPTEGKT